MSIYFFALFSSFIFNSFLIIPFINLLYRLKFQRQNQITKDPFNNKTPIFDKFNQKKTGKPVGGGILIIITTLVMFFLFLSLYPIIDKKITSIYVDIVSETKILLFTFFSFGLLGLYDDLRKIFFWKSDYFFGLRIRHKLLLEIILALVISFWLFFDLKIDFIHIPFFGVFNLSYWYILFSTFVIVAFANAVNITDGLDGLAIGILMIALFAFWTIAASILDAVTATFISVWLGGLISFLYFNVSPARLFLGDTGALSFGATFAVIGLILGKVFALPIIGGFFVLEVTTSLLQLCSKKILGKKIFTVAPLHLYLQNKGWDECKIVMRVWLISIMFAIFGLMISFMK